MDGGPKIQRSHLKKRHTKKQILGWLVASVSFSLLAFRSCNECLLQPHGLRSQSKVEPRNPPRSSPPPWARGGARGSHAGAVRRIDAWTSSLALSFRGSSRRRRVASWRWVRFGRFGTLRGVRGASLRVSRAVLLYSN